MKTSADRQVKPVRSQPQTETSSKELDVKTRWRCLLPLVVGLFLTSLLSLFVLSIFRPYLGSGFAAGYDTLIHFFKVAHVKNMIASYGTYVDWNDQWYAGYHQFLFYPPLFYAFAVFLDYFLNNLELTSKVTVVIAVIASGLSAYFLGYNLLPRDRKVWERSLAAFTVAVSYSLNPALLSFIITRGKYPDYFAIAVTPFAFALLVRWLRSDRNQAPFGFAISIAAVLLLHIDIAVMLVLAAFIYSLLYMRAELGQKALPLNPDYYRPMFFLFLSFVLFAGMTAFFWLPYLAQIKTLGALEQLYPSRGPLPLEVFMRGRLVNGISRYPGLFALALAMLPLVVKKIRPTAWIWPVLLITGFGMSLISYTSIAASFPSLNLLFYRSGIVLAALSISAMVGITIDGMLSTNWLAWSQKIVPIKLSNFLRASSAAALVLLLTAGIVLDYSFIFTGRTIETSRLVSGSFARLFDFLKKAKQTNKGRLLLITPPIPKYTFLPQLIDKPIINGYEAQASRLSPDVEVIKQAATEKRTEDLLLTKFEQLNIQLILIDKISYPKADKNLSNITDLKLVYSDRHYDVFEFRPPGFIQAIDPVLIIGSNRDYPKQVLTSIKGIGFIEENNRLIDDFAIEYLEKYRLIILHNFEAHSIERAEGLLDRYLRKGGKLIIGADGSLSNMLPGDSFLGARITTREFPEPRSISTSLKSKHANNDVYGKQQGAYFSGLDENWMTVDGKYSVLGVRRIGKGEALFVGYKLFYNAIGKENKSEADLLREATKRLLRKGHERLRYSQISDAPWRKDFKVDVQNPTWALISMSWSPYWRAYIDGKEVETRSYENLLALYLPAGRHRIGLSYRITAVHLIANLISASSFIAFTIAMLLRFTRRIK